jgi:hypothetical protein
MAAMPHFPVEHDPRGSCSSQVDPPAGSCPHGDDEDAVLTAARAAGFCLLQCETDRGLIVWEWRRGIEPRPQFGSRRVALHWMSEYLERHTPTPYVSDAGAAFRHASNR